MKGLSKSRSGRGSFSARPASGRDDAGSRYSTGPRPYSGVRLPPVPCLTAPKDDMSLSNERLVASTTEVAVVAAQNPTSRPRSTPYPMYPQEEADAEHLQGCQATETFGRNAVIREWADGVAELDAARHADLEGPVRQLMLRRMEWESVDAAERAGLESAVARRLVQRTRRLTAAEVVEWMLLAERFPSLLREEQRVRAALETLRAHFIRTTTRHFRYREVQLLEPLGRQAVEKAFHESLLTVPAPMVRLILSSALGERSAKLLRLQFLAKWARGAWRKKPKSANADTETTTECDEAVPSSAATVEGLKQLFLSAGISAGLERCRNPRLRGAWLASSVPASLHSARDAAQTTRGVRSSKEEGDPLARRAFAALRRRYRQALERFEVHGAEKVHRRRWEGIEASRRAAMTETFEKLVRVSIIFAAQCELHVAMPLLFEHERFAIESFAETMAKIEQDGAVLVASTALMIQQVRPARRRLEKSESLERRALVDWWSLRYGISRDDLEKSLA